MAECGVMSLDLLTKFGIMTMSDESYTVAPDFEAERVYTFDNVKMVNNIDKFVRNIVGGQLSLNEQNVAAKFLRL